MPELLISTPFGIPEDAATGRGTTATDMQSIIAPLFEYRSKGGSSSTRAGIIRHSWGVELRPDTTVRIHEGLVLLDAGSNKATLAPIPYIAAMETGLPVGTPGTVVVYVAPPAAGSNRARVGTSTAATIDAGWVVLERLRFPSGWKTSTDAARDWDYNFAVLQGTSRGQLAFARDVDEAIRVKGTNYKKLSVTFTVPTDANVTFELASTIRAATAAGSALDQRGSVHYELWVDNERVVNFEREIGFFATTESWSTSKELAKGEHTAWIITRFGVALGTWTPRWQVVSTNSESHHGDVLRIVDGGVRR